MITLPAERDLPPAARETARARAVAAVTHPAVRRRRWVPLAAAAALLAVVGGSALAVSGRQPAPVPSPAGPASTGTPKPTSARLLPPERDIARRCVLNAGPAESAGVLLRAVFTDERGYVAWVAGGTFSAICAYRWDGSRDSVQLGSGGLGADGLPAAGYAAARDTYVTSGLVIGMIERSRPPAAQLIFVGQVARDVARVDVAWSGRPAVRATLRGPYYLARVLSPPERGRRPELRGSVTAYDRDGRSFGPLEFVE